MQTLDWELIERIAEKTFKRCFEAERAFIISMLKAALWFVGLTLSALAGILGFVGWQQMDDLQREVREHAQQEVQRYINEQVALKDARAELDRQYGEALVRTLRNGGGAYGEAPALSRAQVERLLLVLLSPETSGSLFEETAEILTTRTNTDESWFPAMQERLIQDGVILPAFADADSDRRDRLVELLATLGTQSAARPLRRVLEEPHLSPESAHAILDFERRVRPEPPMDKAVLLRYAQRNGPDALVAAARALLFVLFPNDKDARSWIVALPLLQQDQRGLYAMTLRNLLHDTFSADPARLVADEVRRDVLTLAQHALDECSTLELTFSEDVRQGTLGTLLQPAQVFVTCTLTLPPEPIGWRFTIEERTFAHFMGAELNEAMTRGANVLAATIDEWSSRVAAAKTFVVTARSGRREAKITLAHKVVFSTADPLSAYKLVTVPDPSAPGKRLPAMMTPRPNAASATLPVTFDAMEGFSLGAQLIPSMTSALP